MYMSQSTAHVSANYSLLIYELFLLNHSYSSSATEYWNCTSNPKSVELMHYKRIALTINLIPPGIFSNDLYMIGFGEPTGGNNLETVQDIVIIRSDV